MNKIDYRPVAKAGMAIVLCALLAGNIHAAPGTRYTACASCAPQDLAWGEGEFDQVHLVAASGDVRNLHPQVVSTEMLGRALAGLRVANGAPLFDPDAAATLATGLGKALAKAGPQQDAAFLVTTKPGGGVLGTRLGNSGRAFIDSRGLNLIVAEAHVEFVGKYRATRMERPFDFGSRAKASPVTLAVDSPGRQRNDWVVIPLNGSVTAERGVPAPVPASLAVPAERNEQYYQAQETRLKALKRLREQDLIDEKEYQAKRSEILKAW